MGFGAAYLDTLRGMEMAKDIQRRDESYQAGLEDRQRQIKRDNLSMEAAQFGLDTAKKNQSRSDAGYQANERLRNLQREIGESEAEFAKRMQPGNQALAGEQQKGQIEQLKMTAMGRMWEMFRLNPKAGIEAYNKSNIIDPGMEISGFATSPDGKQIIFKDPQGQPIHGLVFDIDKMDQLVARMRPGKVLEVEPGKSIVEYRDGKATPLYTAPDKPLQDVYTPIPADSPGLVNRRTGAVTPLAAGSGAGLGTGTKLDQRVSKGKDVIIKVFGGTFDSIGNLTMKPGTEQQVTRALTRLESLVKSGADPMAAAQQAIDEVQRDATLKGLTAPPGATPGIAAPQAGPTNWRDFVRSQEAGTPAALQ